MKKVILLFSFLALLLVQEVSGQTARPIVPDNFKVLNPGNGYLNSLNTRALRDFLKKYEKATDVVWYGVDKGFIVRFRIDSALSRSAYTARGQWVYTIKQYYEKQMLRNLRAMVKSSYYDYEITLVEEIEQPNQPVKYIVHLQDDVCWKNLLVSDGKMEVIEDRKKL